MPVSTARSSPTVLLYQLVEGYLLRPGLEDHTALILNVGSGRGLTSRSQIKIINVDSDPEILSHSGPLSAAADGSTLPFPSNSFDGILAKDVVEHAQDPIRLLAELRRVSKPSCPILVTVPRAIPRAVWADPTHIRGFTKPALVAALELAGWTVDLPPRRIGALPGAGRWPLLRRNLTRILAIPLLGHYYGTNWIVRSSNVSRD